MAKEKEFVDIARDFLILVGKSLDPYTSEKSQVKVGAKGSVSMFTPAHIQFAKYGRGPSDKLPPIDSIIDFVKKKGIIFEDSDEQGTAFAIAMSISKKGTKNWVPNAPNAIQEAINAQLNKYYDEVEKANTEKTNLQIMEIFEKTYPLVINLNA